MNADAFRRACQAARDAREDQARAAAQDAPALVLRVAASLAEPAILTPPAVVDLGLRGEEGALHA